MTRKLANLILDSDSVLHNQWYKGIWNVVTDSLSRDVHLFSNTLHVSFLQKTIAKQLPPNFQIVPLPEKISSFIILTLQQLPVKQKRLNTQKASELAHSKLGNHVYTELTSQDPCIWMDSVLSKKISSFLPLFTPYEHAPSLQEITDIWWKE